MYVITTYAQHCFHKHFQHFDNRTLILSDLTLPNTCLSANLNSRRPPPLLVTTQDRKPYKIHVIPANFIDISSIDSDPMWLHIVGRSVHFDAFISYCFDNRIRWNRENAAKLKNNHFTSQHSLHINWGTVQKCKSHAQNLMSTKWKKKLFCASN